MTLTKNNSNNNNNKKRRSSSAISSSSSSSSLSSPSKTSTSKSTDENEAKVSTTFRTNISKSNSTNVTSEKTTMSTSNINNISSKSKCEPNADESKKYWENVDATVDGMLGGFTQINRIETMESRKLLSEYFIPYKKKSPVKQVDLVKRCTKESSDSLNTEAITTTTTTTTTIKHSSSMSSSSEIGCKGDTASPLAAAAPFSSSTSSPSSGHPVSTPPSTTTAATSCLASVAPATTAKCGRSDESFSNNVHDSGIKTESAALEVKSNCTSVTKNKNNVKRNRNKYRQCNQSEFYEEKSPKVQVDESHHKQNQQQQQQQELPEEPLKRTALHALDCGAGIGRITKSVLLSFSHYVDLLEQNEIFLNKSTDFIGLEDRPRIGKLIASSLQSFEPSTDDYTYDIIWVQWVTGYLNDSELVTFFTKCASILTRNNGLIFVKDNVTSQGEIDSDMNDSSITRPRNLLESLFIRANLQILQVRKQVKFPRGLYPVYMWVLDVKDSPLSSPPSSSSSSHSQPLFKEKKKHPC